MNTAAEFHAALPEPHSVLGLRLLPLSIGRYRMLARHGCAYVAEGEATAQADDLIFGAVVCAQPVADFERDLSNGRLQKDLEKYGKQFRKALRKSKGFNLFEHMKRFENYIAEGQQVPWVVMPRNQNAEQSAAHWSTSIELVLRGKVGWTKEEIDEQPLTKALADYFKFAESEGAVSLYSRDEYEELNAEAEANGNALLAMCDELAEGANN
jgi:hypothetical protein